MTPPQTAPRRRRLAASATVLLTTGRVLAAHWPALLSLALVGVAARQAAIWGAVELSNHSSVLAQFLLVLAPLGFLIPLIAMVRVAGSALPNVRALDAVRGPDDVTTGHERRLVDVMASVLVPFFGVYVSLGLLEDDVRSFRNAASTAEFSEVFTDVENFDPDDRIGLNVWWVVLAIVAGAWVVRWLIARAERNRPLLALAGLGVVVEVYYTFQAANLLDVWTYRLKFWVLERRAVAWGYDAYEDLTERASWLTTPLRSLIATVASLDAVIVVPVAWLVIGAVVLGHKLTPPQSEDRTSRFLAPMPRWAAGAVQAVGRDVAERFGAFTNGLRMLRRGGLAAALLFCLAFLLATRIPFLLGLLTRQVTGPMDTATWLALSPYEIGLGLVVSSVVIAALVAAATDWIIAASTPAPQAAPSAAPPAQA